MIHAFYIALSSRCSRSGFAPYRLKNNKKHRIRKAIEERLQTAPHDYGEPLRKTLKGYWKLRVGDYRVVFKVIESEVWILGIRHRKSVYMDVGARI
jgi:mRNA interferase RelE/StbE